MRGGERQRERERGREGGRKGEMSERGREGGRREGGRQIKDTYFLIVQSHSFRFLTDNSNPNRRGILCTLPQFGSPTDYLNHHCFKAFPLVLFLF